MTQRINHLAMTYPKGTFTDEFISDLRAFYGGIFGWEVAKATIGDGRENLGESIVIFFDEDAHQHLVLIESDNPMTTGGFEHLGITLDTPEEAKELLAKCQEFAEKDDRVKFNFVWEDGMDPDESPMTFDNGFVRNWISYGCQVQYLMPVAFDVLCHDYKPGHLPEKAWQYS